MVDSVNEKLEKLVNLNRVKKCRLFYKKNLGKRNDEISYLSLQQSQRKTRQSE